jgi:hypothetical protein
MATLEDVRRIALSFPDVIEQDASFGFGVPHRNSLKGFCWSWKERLDPKKARVENLGVLGVRTSDLEEKEALLESDPKVFFTEPHYDGYRAVLVRLDAISVPHLEELLTDAWLTVAAKRVIKQWESGQHASA